MVLATQRTPFWPQGVGEHVYTSTTQNVYKGGLVPLHYRPRRDRKTTLGKMDAVRAGRARWGEKVTLGGS